MLDILTEYRYIYICIFFASMRILQSYDDKYIHAMLRLLKLVRHLRRTIYFLLCNPSAAAAIQRHTI